jgi:hypothetical protein
MRIATFLSNHKSVKLDFTEVVTQINEKVEILQQSNLISNSTELKQIKNNLEDLYQIPNANNTEMGATAVPKSNINPEKKLVERMYVDPVKVAALSGI